MLNTGKTTAAALEKLYNMPKNTAERAGKIKRSVQKVSKAAKYYRLNNKKNNTIINRQISCSNHTCIYNYTACNNRFYVVVNDASEQFQLACR